MAKDKVLFMEVENEDAQVEINKALSRIKGKVLGIRHQDIGSYGNSCTVMIWYK